MADAPGAATAGGDLALGAEEKHRESGKDDRSRDRDRRRSRSRDRRDRGRDRRAKSPSPQGYVKFSDREKSRGGDRDRRSGRDRRRRRSPSSSSDSVDNFYKSGSRNVSGRGSKNADTGPKKIWDGFQWVTQAAGLPASVMNSTGLSRKARRLHFGNLPPGTHQVPGASNLLAQEIFNAFTARGLTTQKENSNPVLSVWLSEEQCFAFVEFVTAEDAANALLLDGMVFMGQPLRIARPSDYTPSNASVAVAQQLMMQQAVTDPAMLAQMQQQAAADFDPAMLAAAGAQMGGGPQQAAEPEPTPVLILTNLTGEGTADADLADILEDVQEESAKYGKINSGMIVKAATAPAFTAVRPETKVGDVYLEFLEASHAMLCYKALHGRMFAGNQVVGSFCDPTKYAGVQANT